MAQHKNQQGEQEQEAGDEGERHVVRSRIASYWWVVIINLAYLWGGGKTLRHECSEREVKNWMAAHEVCYFEFTGNT